MLITLFVALVAFVTVSKVTYNEVKKITVDTKQIIDAKLGSATVELDGEMVTVDDPQRVLFLYRETDIKKIIITKEKNIFGFTKYTIEGE